MAIATLLGLTFVQHVTTAPAAAVIAGPRAVPVATGDLERPDEASAQTTARVTGRRVKITDLTTETSEFWANPDGTITTEAHLGPVRMRGTDGGWTPVDLTLQRSPGGGVAPKAHPHGLALSGGAGTGEHDLVALGAGDQRTALRWDGVLPEPVLDGTVARYPEVRPGVDLVVEATRTGYEQFIIVKNAAAVDQVRSVTMGLHTAGLTATTEDGGLRFTDKRGTAVGHSPAPLMWDATIDPRSMEHTRRRQVGLSLRNNKLTLTPDRAWMTDPATRFPVTIDPPVSLTAAFDTFVQTSYTTDQSTATELRLGTYNGGADVARSFLRFNTGAYKYKQIRSAQLYLWNWHSWSCTSKSWELWMVGNNFGTGTRWTAQPAWQKQLATSTETKGYSGSCGDGWVKVDARAGFQTAVDGAWGSVGFGIRAAAGAETDNFTWKRFNSSEAASNDPYVLLTYNGAPAYGARTTVPATNSCATGSDRPYLGSKTPTLRSVVSDPDGDKLSVQFQWWHNGSTLGTTTVSNVASGSTASAAIPAGVLTEDAMYGWRLIATDSGGVNGGYSPFCEFTVDTTAPSTAPTVTSTDYPTGIWSKAAGTAGSFTLGASGVSDVAGYEYGLDVTPPNQTVDAPSLAASATVSVTPSNDGPHTLYVRSRDRAGNQSAITAYTFNVGAGAVTSPREGDVTASKVALSGLGQAGAAGAAFQWRRADTDIWADIPVGHVAYAAGGSAVSSWPIATTGSGQFPKLVWDVAATLAAADTASIPRDGPLQVRAVFTGSAGTASTVRITFDRDRASAAAQQVGPGSVNLVTGNFTLTDADASVDSYGSDLTVTRSYNTRRSSETDAANMFGPGWVSGVVVDEAQSDYTGIGVYGSLIQVGLSAGDTLGFTKTPAGYAPEIGAEDLRLTYASGADAYTLTDLDGNATTFTRTVGAAAGTYQPTSVILPGSGQSTTTSWQTAIVNGATVTRPTRMLAPVPDGVACTTLARGCRALDFTYATNTTATGTTEATWGDYAGRVSQVSFTAWDPDLATPALRTIVVTRYAYDDTGRLRSVWDPRLDYTDSTGTHHVGDVYAYDADGVLTTLKPAGQEPWQLSYTTLPADPGKGRLRAASRSALSAGTATTTVVYDVPTAGTGAPYEMSATQTARWYQNEPPVAAAAVFPASQVPDGNPAAGTRPSSYERATISYLDANGREVNTAVPGGHTSTTWYDTYGNTVRTLTAGNRQRALNASGTDSPDTEVMLSRRLSTMNIYTPDGRRLIEIWGPEHDVLLDNGTALRGRTRTVNTYDEGAPTTGAPYDLITTAKTGVVYTNASGTYTDADMRTTKTEYNWTLRKPTAVITDPSGLAFATRTTYDPITGLETSVTAPPGGMATNSPATRSTVYYRATTGSGHAECDSRPEWANLPCRYQPGGQAASGPELPITVTTYDQFNRPRTVTEKTAAGTVLRTTATSYDSAGRVYETAVTASTGTPVPVRRQVYDTATGQLTRTQTVASGTVTVEIVRGYDALGRLTSYRDADGNTSTTTYDLLSRTATSSDGKLTRTYGYDGGSERRGLLTSVTDAQAGGSFGAAYDADGVAVTQTWPGGVAVTTTVDETGAQVGLSYVDSDCATADCTLYAETVLESVHGQWRQRVSGLSTDTYAYDAAARLTGATSAVDRLCVSRTHGYNAAGSRTSLTEYAPGAGGVCQSATASASRSWTFDTADRLNASGYVYDALGRTTVLSAVDTGSPAGGNTTITYHANDLVDTITQGARKTDYTLDVDGERIRSWTDNLDGTTVTAVHHYDGDDDSPAWTHEPANGYTRMIGAVFGVAATYNSSNGVLTWQLANLHGDLIATVQDGDAGLSTTSGYGEFGTPLNTSEIGTDRYGWLGAKQRAADTPTGLVLMGVRLYNSSTGRFLQTDPIYGGSCAAYEYACADPINSVDLDGKRRSSRRAYPCNYRNAVQCYLTGGGQICWSCKFKPIWQSYKRTVAKVWRSGYIQSCLVGGGITYVVDAIKKGAVFYPRWGWTVVAGCVGGMATKFARGRGWLG